MLPGFDPVTPIFRENSNRGQELSTFKPTQLENLGFEFPATRPCRGCI